ncbi:cardiolipin synthase [Aureimonas fodinaquatilis]|uniref:Cardiolipin synthase n=1 Tax=Aureimonas fodinaquatilis TaxID=2565783 RepID=A0A5B0DWD2_9HYPH|nr:cardiolipin synthase [Aureimonas fodinaquatilis]KAA0970743.1 cardiolipin synthase [Aureimonas fodinaquatilis]
MQFDGSHWSYWSIAIAIANWTIIFGSLIYIPFRRSPAAAQAWMILFFFLPIAALLIYLLFGHTEHPRWRQQRLKKLPGILQQALGHLSLDEKSGRVGLAPRHQMTANLVRNIGRLPCLAGNHIDLDADYNRVVDRIAGDIDRATHHVHLMFYILQNDEAGNKVLSALERAAERGVQCRLLIDAIGSSGDRRAIARRLAGTGVQLRVILPLSIWNRATRADLRNHRKIVVVDGMLGWVGSQNMHRIEYEPKTFYREVMARVIGPVVLELQAIFIGDWYLETGEDISSPELMPFSDFIDMTDGAKAQVLPSGPDYPGSQVDILFTDLIYNAREKVVLATPYFIPNEPLLQAFQTAVSKGVQVTLFVTSTTNSFLIDHAQRSYYEELLTAGVEVMLYRERFLHAKHLSIDEDIAVIGSANMDRRSFELNSEVTLLVYDNGLVTRLRKIEQDYRTKSHRLDADQWAKRGFATQLMENIMRLISPLL